MKNSIYIFVFFLISFSAYAQNYMEVNDPQSWWNDAPGSVENLEFAIRPQGIYAEVQMTFDVKPREDFMTGSSTPLEFVFQFHLPENIVFNDSWLWIENYISKGDIYERYEGTQIYEDIVDRRQDPSILTKHSPNRYSLRIYPLDPDSTRKVMISYLVPFQFEDREAVLELPFDIFRPSFTPPENISMTVFDNPNWSHYEPQSGQFTLKMVNGTMSTYEVTNLGSGPNPKLYFMPFDISKNYYFGTYNNGNEKFYQLAYFPEVDLDNIGSYNMVIIDYDDYHTTSGINKDYVLDQVQSQLSLSLSENDFFNICYADFLTNFSSEDWKPATKQNIEEALAGVKDAGIDNYSRLSMLLPEALNFINEKKAHANLFIVSANAEYVEQDEAENYLSLIEEFIEEMEVEVSISVMDYANRQKDYDWIAGDRYYGNEYFYNLLTTRYGGYHYSDEFNDRLDNSLVDFFSPATTFVTEYNFDIETQNGFSFASYIHHSAHSAINIKEPIISIGKFVGEYPFTIEFQGIIQGQTFDEKLLISEADRLAISDTDGKLWYSNYLLENEYSNNSQARTKVIEVSKDERLLCANTIFLCLEPDTITISSNNEDDGSGGTTVAVEDVDLVDSDELQAYPNPFSQRVTLMIPHSIYKGSGQVRVEILSQDGKTLLSKMLTPIKDGEYYTIELSNFENMLPGMYIFRITSESLIINKKLVYTG